MTRQAVVAGDREGDEGLNTGVADVLKLLEVGGVHVGFVGIEARGAPADVPNLVEICVAGLESGALFKWIACELCGEGVEREGGAGGGDECRRPSGSCWKAREGSGRQERLEDRCDAEVKLGHMTSFGLQSVLGIPLK